MLVESVMKRDVGRISPDASLMDAAKLMKQNNLGSLVVTNSGRVTGVITDRDIVVRCAAEGAGLGTEKVSAHMSSPVVTVTPQTDIFEAVHTMRNHGIQRLPVEQDDKLVGIVSMGDIAQAVDGPLHDLVIGNWKHSAQPVAIAERR